MRSTCSSVITSGGHMASGRAQRAHDDALAEQGVADAPGPALPSGSSTAQTAPSPRTSVDQAVGLEAAQPVGQARADDQRPVEQALALDDVQVGQAGGRRGGVARVGVAVAEDEVGVGLQRRAWTGPPTTTPAQRDVARGHALGEGDQVGADAVVLGAEPAPEPAEGADDLVDDEEGAVVVAEPAELGQVALGRGEDAARALDAAR